MHVGPQKGQTKAQCKQKSLYLLCSTVEKLSNNKQETDRRQGIQEVRKETISMFPDSTFRSCTKRPLSKL